MIHEVIGTEGPGGHNRKLKVTASWRKCLIFRKKGLLSQQYKYLKFRMNFKTLEDFSWSVAVTLKIINYRQQKHSI